MKTKFGIAAILWNLLWANTVLAVEATSIADRYRLVGVIAAADKKGQDASLAVIKDEQTGRSVMVRTGEQLPGSDDVRLAVIRRNEIELSASGQNIVVGYGGGEAKVEKQDTVTEFMQTDELGSYYYQPRSDDSSVPTDGMVYESEGGSDFPNAERVQDLSDSPVAAQNSEFFGRSTSEMGESSLRSAPVEEPRVQRNSDSVMFNEYDPAQSAESDESSPELIGTVQESED
jgi:hypothetical protein